MNGYYIYDDKNYMLKDEKTNVKYCFGDKVKIKVKNANVQTRQIDFLLLDKE
jgi:exoribonuclease R